MVSFSAITSSYLVEIKSPLKRGNESSTTLPKSGKRESTDPRNAL